METFKERMRRIRLRAGFASQGKAADEIGCERGTVSMWEAPSSPVKSVGQEWLFAVAAVYKVRPEWINDLRSKDDGFPWSPSQSRSQHAGPDPAILQEAVSLLLFDLDHGGPRSATSASRLLMDLYRRIEAAGGHLPDDEQARFEAEARTRGQTLDRKLQEAGRGKR